MLKAGVFCVLFGVMISMCAGSHQMWNGSPNVASFKIMKDNNNHLNNNNNNNKDSDGAWCQMCELIMARVKVLIKEKDQEGEVDTTLYNLCDIMKGPARKQCYLMVPMIKEKLVNGFDAHGACVLLQFCGQGNAGPRVMELLSELTSSGMDIWSALSPILQSIEPYVTRWMQEYRMLEGKSEISINCMLCKTAVSLVDKSLEQYKKPLTDYVIGICNDLPAPTNKACSDAMAFYIPTWWDVFFTEIASANEVCYKLGMCKEPIVSTRPATTRQ